MHTFVLSIALLLLSLTVTSTYPAIAAEPPTTIAGGDLPHPVRLAAADEDAFFRRLDPPPELEQAPRPNGPVYEVTSTYWDVALKSRDESRPQASDRALYYPSDGYAVARLDGEDVWLLLDLRQRAILDRYIRLTRDGRLPESPGLMQVLLETSRTEPVDIQVGPDMLSQGESAGFWRTIEPYVSVPRIPANPAPLDRIKSDEDGVWLIFRLIEGRSLQVFYAPNYDNVLVDSTGSSVLYVSPGTHFALLGSGQTNLFGPPRGGASQIPQEQAPGSRLWWFVMAGGGLLCLAAAFYLRRRYAG